MTLTVLNDDEIRALLEGLTPAELEGFRGALAAALHEDSTSRAADGDGTPSSSAIRQPERTSVHSPATGATTLFMPSSSPLGNSVKVITLSSPSPSSSQPPTTTTTTTPNPNPATTIRPTGAITLFTPDGRARGLVHAGALTAFRTALASLCLVRRRDRVGTLVVFGCGEQAYWHVRLALKARGKDVRHVAFVDPPRRRRERTEKPPPPPGSQGEKEGQGQSQSRTARELLRRFTAGSGSNGDNDGGGVVAEEVKQREGWAGCEFSVVSGRGGDGASSAYEERLGALLREADVVVCCTPSTVELFDAGMLDRRPEGRLVVAIGSYTPAMREVPAELVREAVRSEDGVVVVDTIEGALKEAGELIEARVSKEQLVELGELVMIDAAETGASRQQVSEDSEARLALWLQSGNVIYKSVGMGLMDLAVGMSLVDFAREKGVGTQVPGF